MSSIRGKYAIVGVGEADVGKRPNDTAMTLHLEAATRALADAGLDKSKLDGLVTRPTRTDPQFNYSAVLAARMGIQPNHIADIGLGGASSAAMIFNAVAALESGSCEIALCVNGDSQNSSRKGKRRGGLTEWTEDFESPFGLTGAPITYALPARRHMHEYGTTSQQFGAIAVACRKHACLNSNAQMRTPITVEDHQRSRMVCDPFHLLDCCIRSDAAGAVVITSAERARDFPNRPVYILGMGQFNAHNEIQYAPSMTTVAMRQASCRAYQMAGITPEDVDVAELYDCFTYTLLVTLEDYGFCEKGEGGAFVEGGRIELGGQLPVNTNGGLLSQGHASGFLHITEAATQLRGTAGARQVKDAEIAVVSGQCGALGINVCLVLSNSLS